MSASSTPVADVSAFVEACAIVGGQAEMARRLKVTPAAVNQICGGKRPLPPGWCPEIERETRAEGNPVVCERLAPGIDWGVLRRNPPPATPPTEAAHGPAAADALVDGALVRAPRPPRETLPDHPRRRSYEQPDAAPAAEGQG